VPRPLTHIVRRLAEVWARITSVQFVIDKMQTSDWDQVSSIYMEGIATGNATFETHLPDPTSWDTSHLPICRLVARDGGSILGWAALSPVSSRCVYGGVAEVSVYVAARARGKGIGRRLLAALVAESERNGIWTLQAGILAENRASIAIHEACGFREVGRREKLGKLKGVWRDVVLMERRSGIVGIE
jgi:phosphinothricin acetyltransferase